MSLVQAISRFMSWDTTQSPNIDQETEVREELFRLRANAQQKEVVGNYIKSRKEKLLRDLANKVDEAVPDSVVRAQAARLREVLRWEQDIFVADQQAEKISSWFADWKKKLKK